MKKFRKKVFFFPSRLRPDPDQLFHETEPRIRIRPLYLIFISLFPLFTFNFRRKWLKGTVNCCSYWSIVTYGHEEVFEVLLAPIEWLKVQARGKRQEANGGTKESVNTCKWPWRSEFVSSAGESSASSSPILIFNNPAINHKNIIVIQCYCYNRY